ncbi:MAG: helix-turn-helix transcriptional regulator [Proteobacteria bacterium]|nr:helix-turn-helix transcriptional regulator [Pseudomonadota bacterium]
MKKYTLKNFIDDEIKRDSEFAKEYERQKIIHEIARMIIEIRKSCDLSQVELAKKAGTTQPVIARIESGKDSRIPSLDLLTRIAHAANSKLHISLESQTKKNCKKSATA